MIDIKNSKFFRISKKILPNFSVFILSAFLLFLAYAVFGVYPFGKGSVLVLDLNAQYLYYYEALKNAIFGEGSIFYNWSRNMSGEFFGIFGYYLASPFSIIPVLLPREFITEGILFLQLAKVGTAGVTFAYFLRKTDRSDTLSSVLFGTLYGLIGYTVVQIMNPMWIDGVVYLPLIILGIELLVKEKRILPFAIPMGLMFIANFYIGYMVAVCAAIYFVIFAISEDCLFNLKKGLDRALRAIGGAILAVMIGAITILPIYKVLSLGKMEFSTPPTYDAYEKFPFVSMLGKLLPFSYDSVNVQGLPFVYCGVIILLLCPLYFASKKISIKKKICYFGVIVAINILMYVSTFDLLMHGGQWPNWLNYRYSFVLSFFLLMLGAEAFNNLDSIERTSMFKVYGAIFAIIIFANEQWVSYIVEAQAYWFVLIALTLYIAVALIIKYKPELKRVCVGCLIVFVSCELVFNNLDTFKKIDEEVAYSDRASYTDWYDEFSPVVEYVKEQDDTFYRMDSTYHRCVNDPMALDIYGISHSSSLMNNHALDFLTAMGYTSRGFESKYFGGTIVGDSLIGLKYAIVEWEDNGVEIKPKNRLRVFEDLYTDIYNNGYVLHVYENPYALPIAFWADEQLSSTKLEIDVENNVFENQNKLLNNILGTEGLEFFKEVTVERTLTNMEEYDAVDQMRYVPTDVTLSASIDYSLTSSIDGELYMFIPTKYHRSASINFNGRVVSEYFAEDYHTALGLGKVVTGETNYLSIMPNEQDLYMQTPKFYVLDEALFNEAVNKIRANNSVVTMENAANLNIDISAPENGYIYTSIPYEKGWTVKIDGKKVEPVCIADTLLAIPVTKGEHNVTMSFIPNGFILGLSLFLLAVAICIVIIVLSKRKEKTK